MRTAIVRVSITEKRHHDKEKELMKWLTQVYSIIIIEGHSNVQADMLLEW